MIKKSILALLAVFLALPLYAGTNFPTSIDTYADKNASDVITSSGWNNMQDAIEALETKVGADSSADATSLDYGVANLKSYYSSSGVNVSDLTLLHEIGTTSGVVVSDLTRLHQVMNTAGVSIERLPLGYVQRSMFTWTDADTITIGPGVYHHSGTTNQLVYWNSTLTKDLTVTGSQFYYIYLDDSAIVTAGTNLLTATEIIESTSAPTWSDTKHGWYNGNDRCIFAVYSLSGAVVQFSHDGGEYVGNIWSDSVFSSSAHTTNSGTWNYTPTAPSFATKFALMYQVLGCDLDLTVLIGNNEHLVTVDYDINVGKMVVPFFIAHKTGNYIVMDTTMGSPGSIDHLIRILGWYFPTGM